MDFELLRALRDVETIAAGPAVRSRRELVKRFGRGRWRKMKGIAIVRMFDGRVLEAEVHWYEAHCTGRVLLKRKRTLRVLS